MKQQPGFSTLTETVQSAVVSRALARHAPEAHAVLSLCGLVWHDAMTSAPFDASSMLLSVGYVLGNIEAAQEQDWTNIVSAVLNALPATVLGSEAVRRSLSDATAALEGGRQAPDGANQFLSTLLQLWSRGPASVAPDIIGALTGVVRALAECVPALSDLFGVDALAA